MALKATVFKAEIEIADMNRNYYNKHNLVVARHPSENDLRMMIRLIAFAVNANENMEFTRGLSSEDEPDLWLKNPNGEIDRWIELGPAGHTVFKSFATTLKLHPFGGNKTTINYNALTIFSSRTSNNSLMKR